MPKNLKKIAKPLTYVFLVLSFLVVVLSLYFATEYYYINIATDASGLISAVDLKKFGITYSEGNLIYNFFREVQAANDYVLFTGIIGVVAVAVMAISGIPTRRNYYLSNLVIGIVCPIIISVACIVTTVACADLLNEFNQNKEILMIPHLYTDANNLYSLTSNTFVFTIIFMIVICLYSVCFSTYVFLRYKESKNLVKVGANDGN